MVVRQRWFMRLALFLTVALVLSACERPLRRSDAETPTAQGAIDAIATEVQELATEVVELVEEITATEPAPTPTAASPRETAESSEAPTPEATAEATDEAEPTDTAEATEEAATEATPEATAVEETPAADEPTEAATTEAAAEPTDDAQATTTTLPATHTVAPGETLYRIGLQYGISWVTLAQFNNITNPDRIQAGQVLNIPGGGQAPSPSPSPTPSGEITYVVKPGDNLFRIGLAFNVNWRLIAEANGIINPNQIYVGQTLKIPNNAPGPAPQFTHIVQPGETLFLISLRYGVSWPAVAQANNIASPYVIYVGQTLIIPGG